MRTKPKLSKGSPQTAPAIVHYCYDLIILKQSLILKRNGRAHLSLVYKPHPTAAPTPQERSPAPHSLPPRVSRSPTPHAGRVPPPPSAPLRRFPAHLTHRTAAGSSRGRPVGRLPWRLPPAVSRRLTEPGAAPAAGLPRSPSALPRPGGAGRRGEGGTAVLREIPSPRSTGARVETQAAPDVSL